MDLPPTIVQQIDTLTVTDPNTGQSLRTADSDAAPAVDPGTGKLSLVWQDARDTAGNNHKGGWSRILMTTSMRGPFNFLTAPRAGGFFLGDYEGLAATATGFVGVDDVANCADTSCGSNPTDTYAFGLP
jgi:hypothetical protein